MNQAKVNNVEYQQFKKAGQDKDKMKPTQAQMKKNEITNTEYQLDKKDQKNMYSTHNNHQMAQGKNIMAQNHQRKNQNYALNH